MCVNDLKIAPSESWMLDIVEVMRLTHDESNDKEDLSAMLNFERVQNGASKKWLQNH